MPVTVEGTKLLDVMSYSLVIYIVSSGGVRQAIW
jgi:hypothetical protein